jgi:hypothetical protein
LPKPNVRSNHYGGLEARNAVAVPPLQRNPGNRWDEIFMTTELKNLKSLPRTRGGVKTEEPMQSTPPMQFEPPHKMLARLTSEQERLTQEIREHKTAWAQRNMVAQNKRQTISTAELTAFKQHHGELSKALAETSLKIGELNRELRANKVARQNGKHSQAEPEIEARRVDVKVKAPMKRHKEFSVYFLLAAEQELDKRMFDKIVSVSKSMLANALEMGVEEAE